MASPYEDIPDVHWISSNRFQYIIDNNVRQNVAVCFQYITFLVVTKSIYARPGSISLSLNRDIVVHTAAMVEAILHYGVTTIIGSEPDRQKSLSAKWVRSQEGIIHNFDGGEEAIFWIKQTKQPQIYSDNPSTEYIIKAAYEVGLITEDLYIKADAIRVARNNIHFKNKPVSYPSDQTVRRYFEDSKSIFDRVKIELAKYNKSYE